MKTPNMNTHPTTEWDGVALDEYKGQFGLVRMRKGGGESSRGVWYKQWAFPALWNKGDGKNTPGPKPLPVSVRLGDKKTALEILTKLLEEVQRS